LCAKVECVAWLGDVIGQKKVVGRRRPNFCNRNTNDGEMSQKKVRVRTLSDHKIGVFSLGEDEYNDA
jgi:hypothetical protein